MEKAKIIQKFLFILLLAIIIYFVNLFPLPKPGRIFAEKSGLSPESGADSKLHYAYDLLDAKGDNYGVTEAGDWDSVTNNWGTYLNRIMESAFWEPDGTLTVGEVSPGKTFYSASEDRTQKTGTGTIYSTQSLVSYDDYEGPGGNGEATNDYTGEESTWSQTSTSPEVWKDNRTGLYWSSKQEDKTNIFPDQDHSLCPFFSTQPRGAYYGAGSANANCGLAINECADLNQIANTGGEAKHDWYLPSQKELMQAYIDGMFNQAGTTPVNAAAFTTTSYFWSSTERSNVPNLAWSVALYVGTTGSSTKVTSLSVRCVRRD